MSRFTIHTGDCRDVLRGYPDATFDSVVSDPPYGLTFMGKGWDRGVPGVEFWQEALRVAKPGAHLLAFGGTRTFHRLTVAIEDAGWEVRDCVMWLYGSGFPKSLDVGKAIDKRGGNVAAFEPFRDAVKDAMAASGVSRKQLTEALGNHMLSHYLTAGSQPAVPTADDYRIIRDVVGLGSTFDHLFLDEAEREVIGQKTAGIANPDDKDRHTIGGSAPVTVDVTAPATDAARQWHGWGTALKPAWEPVIVARKPLDGTVASNVLRYGTGALNIDGCRVGNEVRFNPPGANGLGGRSLNHGRPSLQPVNVQGREAVGRWPANLLHDGSDEVLAGFPDAGGGYGKRGGRENATVGNFGLCATGETVGYGDSGSAARFFYCAKASRTDREEGCDHLPARSGADAVERDEGSAGLKSPRAGADRTADTVRNFHPTVKPTDLMRYLCRLVTQPNGLVLDPFCGSGSTGKGAVLEGFRFVGIDLDPAHVAIAEARCQFAVDTVEEQAAAAEAPGAQLSLF